MSFDAGTIFARLGLDDSDFDKSLEKLGQKMQALSGVLIAGGAGLTAGVTAPILGIGAAALKMASQAEESENLVRESFQGMTAQAEDWSKNLSDSLGLNEFELRKQAASFQLLAENMEQPQDAAFGMATRLTELATDLESFLNIPVEDVTRNLQSGLVGNTEALRSLNIFVNQATLEQVAWANGIAETGQKLTQSQKFLATYEAILQQTSKAQGDLARTLDSPLNMLRAFGKRIEEAAIRLGQSLLPVFSKLLPIVDVFVSGVEKAVAVFSALPSPIQTVVVGFAALAAAVGPALLAMGGLVAIGGSVSSALGAIGFSSVTSGLGMVKTQALALASSFQGTLTPSIGQLLSGFQQLPSLAASGASSIAAMGKSLLSTTAATAGMKAGFFGVTASTAALSGAAVLAGGAIGVGLGRALTETGARLQGVDDPIRRAVDGVGLLEGASSLLSGALDGLVAMIPNLGDALGKIPFVGNALKVAFEAASIAAFELGDRIEGAARALFEHDNSARDATVAAGKLGAASFIAGREITDMGEAMAIIAGKHQELEREAQKLAGSTEAQAKALADQAREMLAAKEITDKLSKASSLAGQKIEDMALAEEILRQSTSATTTELDRMVDSLESKSFESLAQQAGMLDTALARMKGTLPIDEARRLRDQWQGLTKQLGLSVPQLEAVFQRASAVREAGKRMLQDFLQQSVIETPKLTGSVAELAVGMEEALDVTQRFPPAAQVFGTGLSNAQRVALGMPPVLETMSEKTTAFGSTLQETSVLLAGFKSSLASIFAGGASFAKGFDSLFGKGLDGLKRSFKTEANEFSFGSLFSGLAKSLPAVGQLVAPVFSLLGKLFKPKWQQIAKEGANLFGKEFSEQLSKQLEKDLKSAGSLQNAISKNIGDVVEEVGVNAQNLTEHVRQFEFALGSVQNGTMDLQEQAAQLTKAFFPITDELRDMGIQGQLQIGALTEQMRELGVATQEFEAFLKQTAQQAVQELTPFLDFLNKQFEEGVFGTGEEAASSAAANVGVLTATFAAAAEAAGSLGGAIALLPESFGDLMAQFGPLLEGQDQAFNSLQRYYSFAKNNEEQLVAIDSLITGMGSLAELGLLNAANIESFGAAAVQQFQSLLASTEDPTAALVAMGPQIGTLLDAFHQLGVEVPPELQAIAEQAAEAGANLTPPEGLEDILGDIRDVLIGIGEALGVAAGNAADFGRNLAGLPSGGLPSPGDGGIPHEFGATGFEGIAGINGPMSFTAGEAGPEHVQVTPLSSNQKSSLGLGGGGGGPTTITVPVTVQAGAVTTDPVELANFIADAVGVAIENRLGGIPGALGDALSGTFEPAT